MQYNRLGDSDLEVSEVCLGTMTFGEQNTEGEGHRQLDYAVERGVNFIDTAEMYPVPASAETQGATESIVGSWLARGNRDKVILATKVAGRSPMTWIRNGSGHDRANIRAAIETSLTRLRTDYVDLYQLHWPDRYTPRFGGLAFHRKHYRDGAPFQESLETLNDLVREGKIRHWGVSNETPYGIGQFVKLAEQNGFPKPVSIQNAYNLLNRVFDVHLAETVFHENIGLLAYSPLGFGYLTGKYRNGARPEGSRIQRFPNYAQRYRDKTNAEEAVDAYAELAGDHGLTEMALQFCKSRPFCKSTIIGATDMGQLKQNIDAFDGELSDDRLKEIEAVHRRYPNPCP
ncbi:MAG: aldo/keto reductase [Acidobacteriota bacterium]|nr:aldo/keto reductase [Acidobacteriota bacterium]